MTLQDAFKTLDDRSLRITEVETDLNRGVYVVNLRDAAMRHFELKIRFSLNVPGIVGVSQTGSVTLSSTEPAAHPSVNSTVLDKNFAELTNLYKRTFLEGRFDGVLLCIELLMNCQTYGGSAPIGSISTTEDFRNLIIRRQGRYQTLEFGNMKK